ncbi:SOSS complex subunit C isoform X1 [Anser cygnoides]|uniref:SOSS complex subunit C isoform X1 n=1 Tax=Anser cygnoides TaxID=8845 RepID=UPI0034D21B75
MVEQAVPLQPMEYHGEAGFYAAARGGDHGGAGGPAPTEAVACGGPLPEQVPGWTWSPWRGDDAGAGFQNKNRVAILAELDKEKRKLLMQNQSSTNHPGASIALARSPLNKDFRDHAEQQHIAAQQKAALQHAHAHSSGYFITQDSAFGNLILPVLPRLEAE